MENKLEGYNMALKAAYDKSINSCGAYWKQYNL